LGYCTRTAFGETVAPATGTKTIQWRLIMPTLTVMKHDFVAFRIDHRASVRSALPIPIRRGTAYVTAPSESLLVSFHRVRHGTFKFERDPHPLVDDPIGR
jgi:hypothetical protein